METLDYEYLAMLVRRSQVGDSNAFAELYTATYEKQYSYAYQYLHDEYLAQDALQETFVQALKNINSLQNPTLFVAWLNRINFMVCYDMKKKRKDDILETEAINYLENAASEHSFEEEIIQIDSNKFILNQVMALPLTEAQVILMHYYQEMKIDDIADSLELSRSTVKRYLNSGREHLNQLLKSIQG